MAEALRERRWTTDEFFAWLEDGHGGDDRWELVDGEPRMMVRPVARHGLVVGNMMRVLGNKLRGGPCRPFGGDFGVTTREDQVRYPDVVVDCGPRDMEDRLARDARVVIEVLSPSTRDFDSFAKLDEYRGVNAVRHVVLIDPNRVDVWLWSRGEDGWSETRHTDHDGTLDLPAIGIDLPMSEIYEDVELVER